MKKYTVLPVAALLVLLLLCSAAMAADYDITGTSGTLNIPAGSHTLTGTATGLSIQCAAGVSLTLNGANVISTGTALAFSGTGNEIILAAGTASFFTSGTDKAGILVPGGAVLTIRGSGELTADGGRNGSGIGGNYLSDTGTINIAGGTIYANGGSGGAAIGSGALSDNGTVSISGGTIIAIGGTSGAGIGGGDEGSGGTIRISGGTVTAIGGPSGAGIGGGVYGDGGSVTIAGGIVYAAYGTRLSGVMDIGRGDSGGSDGTLILDDGAAVFLEHDSYASPTILGTQAHYHPVPFVGNTANGITVPAAWTTAQGAFLPPKSSASMPQTGDLAHTGIWIALAAAAGAALSLVFILRRKQRA